MNKTTLTIFVSGATALAGFVSGYLVAKKQLEEQYEALYISKIDEELKKIRESRTKEIESKKETPKPTTSAELVEETTHNGEDHYNRTYAPIVDYTKFSRAEVVDKKTNEVRMVEDEEEPEEPEEEDEGDDPVVAALNDYHNTPPHMVSLQDYKNLPSEFEFVTWHYFDVDDVLIDETDLIVDDEEIERMLGPFALVSFGDVALKEFDTEDPDCVYVVCGHAMLAIEVVRLHRDYGSWSGKWSDI